MKSLWRHKVLESRVKAVKIRDNCSVSLIRLNMTMLRAVSRDLSKGPGHRLTIHRNLRLILIPLIYPSSTSLTLSNTKSMEVVAPETHEHYLEIPSPQRIQSDAQNILYILGELLKLLTPLPNSRHSVLVIWVSDLSSQSSTNKTWNML